VGGIVWTFLPFGGFLVLLLGWGFGLGVAEVLSRSVSLKRGLPLQIIAGSTVLAAVAILVLLGGLRSLDWLDLLAAVLAIVIAASRLA
jgi:hypothetical protein